MSAKEQKRERMLTAARQLFSEQGFERTTMQKIADEARVGVATLFRYFPKKELLIVEVISCVIDQMSPRFEAIMKQQVDGFTKMDYILDAYIDYICTANRDAVILLESFEHYMMYNPIENELLAPIRNAYTRISHFVSQAIQHGLDDGSIQLQDEQLHIFSTIFNLFGTAIKKHASASFLPFEIVPVPKKQQLLQVKALILRYLKGID